jgi:uncharacterized protein YidB (DUF937 family)
MSLTESIFSALGQTEGGGQQGPSAGLLGGITEYINSRPGGLHGLLDEFRQKGAGDLVSSWVGQGENQPVDPQRVQSLLGEGELAKIAGRAGISSAAVSQAVSAVLPHIVDRLTPNARVEGNGQLDAASLLGSLGDLFGGAAKS